MADLVVELVEARKAFGRGKQRTQALDGLDLCIESGGVHALLGPNGAGKSTAVGVVATLTRLDSGTGRVAGHALDREPGAVRRSIGLVTQAPALDEALHAEENLVLFGRLRDLDRSSARLRATDLLSAFGLAEATGRKVSTFSGGMRRRLDIAAAMVTRPPLLILDEPTTGLDPRGRLDVWAALRHVVDEGTTVLLTTQLLDEADQLADHITMLCGGRVAAEGTPESLKRRLAADRVIITPADPGRVREVATLVGGRADDPGTVTVEVAGRARGDVLTACVRALDRAGVEVSDLSLRRPTLDEVFLELTGGDRPPADQHEGARS